MSNRTHVVSPRFRLLVLAVTVLVHVPFLFAMRALLEKVFHQHDGMLPWGIALALASVGIFAFVGRANHIANDWHRPWWQTWLIDLPYFVHWCACVFCLVPAIVYAAFVWPIATLGPSRGAFSLPFLPFFFWTYTAGLVVATYGCTLRRWFFVVRKVDIVVRDLDPRLEGFTIAQLSDLHIGAFTPRSWAMRWVRVANRENADIVVVTGDMVTSGVAFHEDIASVVGALRGKQGIYVIMGNHDYFGDGEPLITLLRASSPSVNVLRNQGIVLERDGAALFLAGIDDTWTKRADLDRTLAHRGQAPARAPVVLLAHDPAVFKAAAARNVDVVLSGHTHGGQIAMPFLGRRINASKLAHDFHIGVYEHGSSTLYVHPGLGTTGPPVRLGVAPAIVLIRLRAAERSAPKSDSRKFDLR